MRTLTSRLVILLMLALMVITGVYDYLRLVREREQIVMQTRDDVRVFSETLALAVSRNIRRGGTTDELKDLLADLLARPGLLAVAIFDPAGQPVAANTAPGVPDPDADSAVRRVLATRAPAALQSGQVGAPVLRYLQPVRWPGGRTGVLEVRQDLSGTDERFRRAVRERIISRLIVLGLFVLTVVALTRWNIGRPILTLIAGARAVGRGDLSQRIRVRRKDEIGELAEEFNRMAGNLQAAHEEILRQAEERLRLEQEVHQSQKLAEVGMLAAEVAHEIGTPLNIISGRAEVLDRLVQEPGQRRHLGVILRQTERITGIIRALLDYTRPRRPNLRPEGIVPILGRVADFLLERSQRRGVRITLDVPVGLPRVHGDPDQLQQLFLNLLMNALDASSPGATVRVAAGPEPLLPTEGRAGILRGKAEGRCLTIHVLDEGKGLTPEQLNHVFEPFFSTKSSGQGTGLGLPIVEEIIRAHRGEVEMLSIPGRGTEVLVRIPLSAEDAAALGSGEESSHGA